MEPSIWAYSIILSYCRKILYLQLVLESNKCKQYKKQETPRQRSGNGLSLFMSSRILSCEMVFLQLEVLENEV